MGAGSIFVRLRIIFVGAGNIFAWLRIIFEGANIEFEGANIKFGVANIKFGGANIILAAFRGHRAGARGARHAAREAPCAKKGRAGAAMKPMRRHAGATPAGECTSEPAMNTLSGRQYNPGAANIILGPPI